MITILWHPPLHRKPEHEPSVERGAIVVEEKRDCESVDGGKEKGQGLCVTYSFQMHGPSMNFDSCQRYEDREKRPFI